MYMARPSRKKALSGFTNSQEITWVSSWGPRQATLSLEVDLSFDTMHLIAGRGAVLKECFAEEFQNSWNNCSTTNAAVIFAPACIQKSFSPTIIERITPDLFF